MPQLTVWRTYAAGLTFENKRTGDKYKPKANNVFIALATKLLQVTPAGTIPVTPPTVPFLGDGITLTVAAATGKMTFTASGKNATGITTEFLLQKLVSKARTPTKNAYRSKGFYVFPVTPLTYDVSAAAGWYAVAYRFVNTATGQESALITLGVVQVN